MAARYSLSSYDDHFCLKPPALLWIAAVFLSRSVLLPFFMAFGSFFGLNSDTVALLREAWNLGSIAPSLIAAGVLVALIRRYPGAPRAVRWLSQNGRTLLALSAAMDLVCSLIGQGSFEVSNTQLPPSWLLTAAADLYFLAYVLFARRVRDTFRDFPLPATQSG